MARVFIALVFVSVLGTGYYLSNTGVWGASKDLSTVRTGSAGVPYYGVRNVK